MIEDTIANELRAAMGSNVRVLPATVIVTGAGQLEQSNNVKKIFHVAAVDGVLNQGFQQVPNVEDCVTRALETMDTPEVQAASLSSIAFPLLGTGHGGGELADTVGKLIGSATS